MAMVSGWSCYVAFLVLQMNAERRNFELFLDGTSHENDASFVQECLCCVPELYTKLKIAISACFRYFIILPSQPDRHISIVQAKANHQYI